MLQRGLLGDHFEASGLAAEPTEPPTLNDSAWHFFGCACAACCNSVTDDSPQAAVLPSSGVAANGKPIFSWDEAAAQIGRPNQFWGGVLGQGATVTYAYRANAPAAMPSNTAGFTPFSEAQIIAAEKAFQYWADVANITFTRVGSGTTVESGAYSDFATILLGNYSSGEAGASAFAYYPGSTSAASVSGDIWVNSTIASNANPTYFTAGPRTLLHEIGHAIGLAHPSNYNATEGLTITYGEHASYWQDANMFTAMSYFASASTGANLGGFANAPQMHDIAAAQRLYGANMSTRTGDTTYGFNANSGRENSTINAANQAIVFAIWDAGGYDTLDLSGYSQNADIDLRPESFSSAGPDTGSGTAVYNISIARGVIIERGIGGSGADTLTGNDAANALIGNDGGDTLSGGAGNDALTGGAGADFFFGDSGFDSFVDVRANMAGDVIHDLGLGERIQVTDVTPGALPASRAGATLSLGAGVTITMTNAPIGRLYEESDGAAGARVFFLTPQHTNDFNTDGLTDILWRLPNGDTALWTMNSNTVTGGYSVLVPGAPWTLAEQADFSGDGKTDLVWRNGVNGDIALWTMSNGTLLAGLGVPNPGAGWSLAGAGDFNADGRSDFLWRNGANGDFAVWMMDSNVIIASGGPGGLPNSWRVTGVSDFDGDGRSDLLLRNNTGNHDLAIWTMDGAVVKAGLGMLNPGAAWQVIATGDFNADGLADIVFRHSGTADIALWEMNGNTLIAGLGIPNPGPTWSIADVNDFNGDGYSDLLWRNSTNGDTALWLMQNNAILAGLGVPNPGGSWAPAVHLFDIV